MAFQQQTINGPGKKGKDLEEKQDAMKRREIKREGSNKVSFYKLFSFADSVDCLLMSVGAIGAAGSGISLPVMTILFGKVVDAFGGSTDLREVTREVSKVSAYFAYLALGSFVTSYFQMTCWMITGQRQAARIRKLYLQAILRQDIVFFDTQSNSGEIIGRISGDTVLIQDAMGEKVGQFIQSVVTFLGGFVIAFAKGWRLTLVLLSSIPPLVLATALMSILVAKLANRGQGAYSEAAIVVEQTISSIKTVASFTGEKLAISKYVQLITKAYKTGVQEGLAVGVGVGTVVFVGFCTCSLATWYGGKMIIYKGYSGEDIITIILAILYGSLTLGQASPCISAFAAGQVAAFNVFETINRKPCIDAYDNNGQKLDDINGDIELKDVFFSYPARPDEQILSGFSLSIPGGSTAALVGRSGSGKSTIVSLIERFYDPQGGAIIIDGINLKKFHLKWIRQKIGLVGQESVLFTSSIKDNITYGKEDATIEEITTAAELANAAKFIKQLPEGLDTMVGEHGTQLSGGQKQRIAIARAVLKDPRILLLDEATSALDSESERSVQESLDKIMINRTTVIVAHRLSTIRNVDMIAVIHRGKIVETGSHVELTKVPDGVYSQLIRLQQMNSTSVENVQNDVSEHKVNSRRHSNRPNFLLQSEGRGLPGNENNELSNVSGASEKVCSDLKTSETSSPRLYQNVPLHRLAYLNKPEVPVLIMAALTALANGAILPIFGLLFSNMITMFYEPVDKLRRDSEVWAKTFLLLATASLVMCPLRNYLFAVAGCRLIRRLRRVIFEKVLYMEISWFDEIGHSTALISAMLSSDAANVRALVGDALGLLVQNISSTIIGLVIAFIANWQLSLIVFVMLPLLGVNGYVQLQVTKGFSTNTKKLYEEATQVANDAVGNIRTVASFCAEEKVLDLYHKKCQCPIKTGTRQGLLNGVGFGLSNFVLYASYSLTFYAAAQLVEDGKATFSDVFRVFFSLTMAALAVSQSGTFVPDTSKGKSSAASIFTILDQKSKTDSSDESGITLEHVKGDLAFRHVSFEYPVRPDVQIFRDLCIVIPSGKTVALVGESGSGKSTVISLLQRFYDPSSGQITLDGMEIHKLQLKWLRQQMGLVSQEPLLFNDTIRANIAYGKGGNIGTEVVLLEAAELANAHRFISALQNGYDTVVGERGIQLSGGQKQRVAIARAIVKNPKILLLDEATSALDAESEKVVQDALEKVMVDRTTIVVAHRLSTIQGVDMIAVVNDGVIAEMGNHESLMEIHDGIYASLVASHRKASLS